MSAIDYLLLAVVLIAAVLAVRSVVRRKKRGGCGCGCDSCPSSCSSRKKQK